MMPRQEAEVEQMEGHGLTRWAIFAPAAGTPRKMVGVALLYHEMIKPIWCYQVRMYAIELCPSQVRCCARRLDLLAKCSE